MKKILVPIDFSEGSVLAVNEGVMFARAFEASLVLLHVIHDPEESPGFYAAKKAGKTVFHNMEESARQMLQDFIDQHLEGFDDFKALTVPGIPAARVLQTAKKRKADLIVMGTRGRGGVDRLVLGSVADKVVRGAACPVLVLREPREAEPGAEDSAADGGIRSVMVPVDFSDGSAAALLCSENYLKGLPSEIRQRAARVSASVLCGGKYRDPDEPSLSKVAAYKAYAMAGIGPQAIDVAEVHDATSFCEIYQVEMLGFCPIGEGGPFVESGATRLDGQIPVNTSGGLVSKGHPVGATGLSMIYELVTQLRGEAADRQVKEPEFALQENGGGVMGLEEAACSVIILQKYR